MGFGKMGARGGFGSAGVLGKAGASGGATLNALTLSASAFTAGDQAGNLIGNVQNLTGGSTLTLFSSGSNQVVLDSANAIRIGLLAGASNFSITLRETLAGYSNSPRDTTLTITVNAAGAPTALVSNTRCIISAVSDSAANGTDIANLLANAGTNSNVPKTKGVVSLSVATRTFGFQLGENAPNGLLLNYSNLGVGTHTFFYSTDSTDGTNGTWNSVTALVSYVSGQTDQNRGQVQPFPALVTGNWIRHVVAETTAQSMYWALYKKPASGLMDLTGIIGMSITIQDLQARYVERYIQAVDPSRDPIIVNWGVTGYKTTDMNTSIVPLISAAISAGVPFATVWVDPGPNDIALNRPRSSNTAFATGTYQPNIQTLFNSIVSAGIDANHQYWSDLDYYNEMTTSPFVNAAANPENGTSPYNQLDLFPKLKSMAVQASVSTALDAPMSQHSVPTLLWVEDMFLDGKTHPASSFYPEIWRRFDPAIRHASGLPIGPTYLEARLKEAATTNVTTAWRKQRFSDIIGQLPSTSDVAATAVRAQATALISALDATLTDYADPTGSFTLPSARAHAPAIWLDFAKLANVSKVATNSMLLASITDRMNAYVYPRAAGTGVYYLENHCNGRSVARGNNASSTNGVNGSFTAGYLTSPAGALTSIDAQADFSIEIWARDWYVTSGTIFGMSAPSLALSRATLDGPIRITGPVTITSTFIPKVGTMHQYVLTYNNTTHVWTLYADGTSIGTATSTKTLWTTTIWNIFNNSGNTSRFPGDLGDLIVTPGYCMLSADVADSRAYGQAKFGSP